MPPAVPLIGAVAGAAVANAGIAAIGIAGGTFLSSLAGFICSTRYSALGDLIK
ncbi:MAG: hypothetical protein ACK502_00720 [Alphaproteobacteria bacterium]